MGGYARAAQGSAVTLNQPEKSIGGGMIFLNFAGKEFPFSITGTEQ